MKNRLILCLSLLVPVALFSQQERKHIREGNRQYRKEKFNESEIEYRKALNENSASFRAGFNLGNALYKQENYGEASEQYLQNSGTTGKEDRSRVFHNLGNTYLQSEKIRESIEAYKEALRNNPGDMETKYNLAYAQRLLKEQQQQEQDRQEQGDRQKDQQQQQDKQDQESGDGQEQQEQQNQEGEQDQQQQQQQQQQPGQISPEAARRILEALAQDEKNVREKVDRQKALAKKIKTEKDW